MSKKDTAMRVLVCGDRNWTNIHAIWRHLVGLSKDTIIIEGEARGVDSLAREVAESLGMKVMPFPADWNKHGRAAGPIRNIQMLKEGKPDLVLAFHPDLEKSKGTKHMVEISKKAGIEVMVFDK